MLTPDTTNGRYISILADGKFHETTTEGTEGAVLREYETSAGNKGSKWELVYSKIDATITNIQFHEGEFGEQIQLTFTDGDNEVILSQGVATPFGEDIMKKLPGVDFSAKLTFQPFAFLDDKGKNVRGVSIYQNGDKLTNHFWDAEKKETLHDFPSVSKEEADTYDTDSWKVHFILARKFLVAYTKENIVSKFAADAPEIIRPSDEDEQRALAASIPF